MAYTFDPITGQVLQSGGGGISSVGGAMTNHVIPDTNSTYDLGSAEFKIRHLYLSNNSLRFEGGDLGVNGANLTFQGENMQVGTLAAVLTTLGVSSFSDNGTALGGGLVIGDVYYNTTNSRLASVTA